MLLPAFKIASVLGLATALISISYLLFSLRCITAFSRRPRSPCVHRPPLTVLKPVHGLDKHLYDNLRSFCHQDYPEFQVIFAVADARDPAIAVIRQLIAALPGRDLTLVVNDRRIGSNHKISNVANAFELAKHDLIVIADSDMRVGRDYLARVAAAFDEPGVGAVTCLYTGSAAGGLPSQLGSMFINESFLPSVLVALSLQELKFCFGATMAIRREALAAIGGFAALGSFLADDYMLGKLVTDAGYKVRLAPYLVENIVFEDNFKTLLQHELRWARTVRTVRPAGYAFSFLTQPVSVSTLFLLLSHTLFPGLLIFSMAIALRVALHYAVRAAFGIPGRPAPWLVPVRDLLCFGIWGASFLGRSVRWRDGVFAVRRDGQMTTSGGLLP